MKRISFNILLLFFVCISTFAQNEILKDTHVYTSKDGKDLKLDRYYIENDSLENKPCVVFLFGGGFVRGERDNNNFLPFFHSLVNNGNTVVSIDYRLGMKGIKPSSITEGNENDFLKLFINTLEMGTQDLMDATTYILYHADTWGVDKKKIIASGSSAGAILALHGEYATVNRLEVANKLPEDFRYAGIISFAGAIFSIHGDLEWKEQPSPMLLFHGSADKSVPYNAVELGFLGFYGSKHITNQLEDKRVPYYFYDEEYGSHSLANSPMHNNLSLINSFIKDEIVAKKGMRIHSVVKVNGREPLQTNYSIKDYILSNFLPQGK